MQSVNTFNATTRTSEALLAPLAVSIMKEHHQGFQIHFFPSFITRFHDDILLFAVSFSPYHRPMR